MNTTLAILLAQSLSLIACILFAVWYVVPWLESRSRTEALVPLVWVHVMRNLQRARVRQRGPYHARHTYVSWLLMTGKNLLWAAEQNGHSVEVMLHMYAKWLEGSTEADIDAIRKAMREDQQPQRQCARCDRDAAGLVVDLMAGEPREFATRFATTLPPADDRRGKWRSKSLSEGEDEWRRGWDCSRPGTAARPPLRSGPPRPRPRRPKIAPRFLSNQWVRPHTPHPQIKKGLKDRPFLIWRRGWDSNPRAGITRPSDFESAPL
jgi:hypothetical protein